MKTQIKKELHSRTLGELEKQLKEKKSEIAKMKMDQKMGKLKNTSELRNKKVEIAVMSTIIKEKQIAGKMTQSAATEEEKEVVAKEKPGSKTKQKSDKSRSAPAKALADKEGGKK
jgi:ribosomal protein L29